MKDFAIIVKSEQGQVFGCSGLHMLEKIPPAEGCSNRWQFKVDNLTLDVIIVAKEKAVLAVLAGHFYELLKAHLRRLGSSLSRI